jgi:hypothetical protein
MLPQIILIIFFIIGDCLLAYDNKLKVSSIIGQIILIGLLIWGGFFNIIFNALVR